MLGFEIDFEFNVFNDVFLNPSEIQVGSEEIQVVVNTHVSSLEPPPSLDLSEKLLY